MTNWKNVIERVKKCWAIAFSKQQNPSEERIERDKDQKHRDLAGILERIADQNDAAANEQSAQQQRNEQRECRRITLEVVAIVAAFIAAGGIWLQQCTMQGQLDEMQAEQRPWVSVKILGPASLLKDVNGNLELDVTYHIENVGKLPATHVFFFATIIPETDASNFRNDINAYCQKQINDMISDINSAGVTLFPNQTIETRFGIEEAPIAPFLSAGMEKAIPFVPVCTLYRFKGDGGKFHFTPAAYMLTAPTQASANPGGPVPKRDIANMPAVGLPVAIHPMAQGNLDPT